MSFLSAARDALGSREEGMALVMTLWILTALAAMVAPLAVGARQDGQRTLRSVEDVTLRAAIDAALARASAEIASGFPALGRERHWRLGDVELRYLVTGESGRVDLNAATPEMLEAVFAAHGLEGTAMEEVRDRLLTTRSAPGTGIFAEQRTGGGPFRHPVELRGVLAGVAGLDPRLFTRLRRDVTVWTAASEPDPVLASGALRLRLPGARITDLETEEPPSPGIDHPDPAGVYRIDIRAELPGGAARRTMVVIAEVGNTWRVREWISPLVFEDGSDE